MKKKHNKPKGKTFTMQHPVHGKIQVDNSHKQNIQNLINSNGDVDGYLNNIHQQGNENESQEPTRDNEMQEGMKYGGIHIKKKNIGKFTATKKATGKTTEELKHSKNPLTRKRAVFAANAKHFHHGKKEDGGALESIHAPYVYSYEHGGFIPIAQTGWVDPKNKMMQPNMLTPKIQDIDGQLNFNGEPDLMLNPTEGIENQNLNYLEQQVPFNIGQYSSSRMPETTPQNMTTYGANSISSINPKNDVSQQNNFGLGKSPEKLKIKGKKQSPFKGQTVAPMLNMYSANPYLAKANYYRNQAMQDFSNIGKAQNGASLQLNNANDAHGDWNGKGWGIGAGVTSAMLADLNTAKGFTDIAGSLAQNNAVAGIESEQRRANIAGQYYNNTRPIFSNGWSGMQPASENGYVPVGKYGGMMQNGGDMEQQSNGIPSKFTGDRHYDGGIDINTEIPSQNANDMKKGIKKNLNVEGGEYFVPGMQNGGKAKNDVILSDRKNVGRNGMSPSEIHEEETKAQFGISSNKFNKGIIKGEEFRADNVKFLSPTLAEQTDKTVKLLSAPITSGMQELAHNTYVQQELTKDSKGMKNDLASIMQQNQEPMAKYGAQIPDDMNYYDTGKMFMANGGSLPMAQKGMQVTTNKKDNATGYFDRLARANFFQRRDATYKPDPRMQTALEKAIPFYGQESEGFGDWAKTVFTMPQNEINNLLTGYYESPGQTVKRYNPNISGTREFATDVVTDPMMYPELPYAIGKGVVKGSAKAIPYVAKGAVKAGEYAVKAAEKAAPYITKGAKLASEYASKYLGKLPLYDIASRFTQGALHAPENNSKIPATLPTPKKEVKLITKPTTTSVTPSDTIGTWQGLPLTKSKEEFAYGGILPKYQNAGKIGKKIKSQVLNNSETKVKITYSDGSTELQDYVSQRPTQPATLSSVKTPYNSPFTVQNQTPFIPQINIPATKTNTTKGNKTKTAAKTTSVTTPAINPAINPYAPYSINQTSQSNARTETGQYITSPPIQTANWKDVIFPAVERNHPELRNKLIPEDPTRANALLQENMYDDALDRLQGIGAYEGNTPQDKEAALAEFKRMWGQHGRVKFNDPGKYPNAIKNMANWKVGDDATYKELANLRGNFIDGKLERRYLLTPQGQNTPPVTPPIEDKPKPFVPTTYKTDNTPVKGDISMPSFDMNIPNVYAKKPITSYDIVPQFTQPHVISPYINDIQRTQYAANANLGTSGAELATRANLFGQGLQEYGKRYYDASVYNAGAKTQADAQNVQTAMNVANQNRANQWQTESAQNQRDAAIQQQQLLDQNPYLKMLADKQHEAAMIGAAHDIYDPNIDPQKYYAANTPNNLKSLKEEKADYEEAQHKAWAKKNGYTMSKFGGKVNKLNTKKFKSKK